MPLLKERHDTNIKTDNLASNDCNNTRRDEGREDKDNKIRLMG